MGVINKVKKEKLVKIHRFPIMNKIKVIVIIIFNKIIKAEMIIYLNL